MAQSDAGEREKGILPISKDCLNDLSGDLELDSEVASIILDTEQDHLPNYRWFDQDNNLKSVRGQNVIK
jgi:hypothetical protein